MNMFVRYFVQMNINSGDFVIFIYIQNATYKETQPIYWHIVEHKTYGKLQGYLYVKISPIYWNQESGFRNSLFSTNNTSP